MEHRSIAFVSVIIPVLNDSERLKICLEALEHQTYPNSLYEVIVIDNGSAATEKVEDVVATYRHAVLVYEPTPGSYVARNTGLAQAKGEVIAFTDSDCIPAPDWLEKGVQCLLNHPDCGLVAGKIELFFKNPKQLTLVELYESVTAFRQKDYLEKHQFAATANVFTFRQVLDQVGLFDHRLKSGGDFEWGRRVAALGYPQVYTDEAQIAHPARYSFAELYRKAIRVAGGMYDAHVRQDDSVWQRNKTFARILWDSFWYPINLQAQILKEPQLKTLNEKLKVALMTFVVRYSILLEIVRLRLGGMASRG